MSIKKTNSLLVIIPVMLLVLFTPFVWRISAGNTTLIGEYTYYSLSRLTSLSEALVQQSFVLYWLLAIAGTFVLTLLFYRLVKLHTDFDITRIIVTLFFVLTPITIFLSISVSPYLLALLLLFAGINLLESRYSFLSILPFLGLLFFDWLTFLSSLVIVSAYLFYTNRKKHLVWAAPFFIVFILLDFFMSHRFVIELLPSTSLLVDFVSDFGSVHGIGIFMVLLAPLGLALSWYDKKRLVPVYMAVAILFALFLFGGVSALYFLYPLVVLFASSAFIYFWKRKWTLSVVRTLTLAVLAYAILFSGLAYANRAVDSLPTSNVFKSTEWLGNHPFYSNAVVLSHPQKGFWIEYNTNNTAFIDYLSEDYNKRLNVTESILESRDFKKTVSLLEEHEISLIWIDEEMRNGQVWNEDDDGLLFLLSNERFLKVYDVGDVEIWRFK